jgi:hypothetical protein
MLEVKTISVSIDRDWHDVYNAIWRPEAFQSWASGLAKSALEKCGDHWEAHGPEGSVKIRFTGHNQFGVMDHYVRLSNGEEIYVPLQVFQYGTGAEVALTLFRQPDMSVEKFEADVAWVRCDLAALSTLFSSKLLFSVRARGRAQGLDRMQDTVRFEDSKRLGKRHTGMEPPPFARVPHPVDIETVLSHAVDTGEGCIELLAAIVLHARPVALHETISPRRPSAMDVDHVIPFGRSDLRQKARPQDFANEGLASRDDRPLFHLVRRRWPRRAGCPYPLLLSGHILDPCLKFAYRPPVSDSGSG